MEVLVMFSIVFIVLSTSSCYYKYSDQIKSEKNFIVDNSTYKCTKTNSLEAEK